MERFLIPELESKKKLEGLYHDQKLSTQQIATLFGVSRSVIRRRLRQFKISTRSIDEATHYARANHVELSSEAISFLTGELLGDGYLGSTSKFSAGFVGASKYRKYLEWLSKTFQDFGIQQAGRIVGGYSPKIAFHYYSLLYAEFKSIYDRFYPEGKKIVPLSLELNPAIVQQWFIGDGSLEFPRKGSRGRPNIKFATDGFTETEVDFLVEKFRNLGFLAKKGRHVEAYIIRVNYPSLK